MRNTDEFFMSIAIEEAKLGLKRNEVPVGCVIVKNGKILSKHHNLTSKGPLEHAEILCIREVSLKGADCYVTIEPCYMCYGILKRAGINRIMYMHENPIFGSGEIDMEKLPGNSLYLLKQFYSRININGK